MMIRCSFRFVYVLVVLLIAGPTWAQEFKMPSKEEMRSVTPPVMPKIDIQSTGGKQGIDLDALMNQYKAQMKRGDTPEAAPQASKYPDAGLFAFVSFTMPEASIKRLIQQASQSGAVVIVRGFYEKSLMKTAKKVRELAGENKVDWRIDPKLFEEHAVTSVPTFVLYRSSSEPLKLSGDIGLEGALDEVLLRDKTYAGIARAMLNRIRQEKRP